MGCILEVTVAAQFLLHLASCPSLSVDAMLLKYHPHPLRSAVREYHRLDLALPHSVMHDRLSLPSRAHIHHFCIQGIVWLLLMGWSIVKNEHTNDIWVLTFKDVKSLPNLLNKQAIECSTTFLASSVSALR